MKFMIYLDMEIMLLCDDDITILYEGFDDLSHLKLVNKLFPDIKRTIDPKISATKLVLVSNLASYNIHQERIANLSNPHAIFLLLDMATFTGASLSYTQLYIPLYEPRGSSIVMLMVDENSKTYNMRISEDDARLPLTERCSCQLAIYHRINYFHAYRKLSKYKYEDSNAMLASNPTFEASYDDIAEYYLWYNTLSDKSTANIAKHMKLVDDYIYKRLGDSYPKTMIRQMFAKFVNYITQHGTEDPTHKTEQDQSIRRFIMKESKYLKKYHITKTLVPNPQDEEKIKEINKIIVQQHRILITDDMHSIDKIITVNSRDIRTLIALKLEEEAP